MRDVGDCRQATDFSRTPGFTQRRTGNNGMGSGSEGTESEQE
jgi:hypothetical protein